MIFSSLTSTAAYDSQDFGADSFARLATQVTWDGNSDTALVTRLIYSHQRNQNTPENFPFVAAKALI